MKSFLLITAACLLALPVPLHAEITGLTRALPALPQAAQPRIGRYVELIVDDQGDGLAAGLFDLAFNPEVMTIVVFPEEIERGKGFPKPEFQIDIQGHLVTLYTTKRRLPEGLQRNVTVFTRSLSVGFMVRSVTNPDDAVALAVVRTRSQVERWQAEHADQAARWQEQDAKRQRDQAILGFTLSMASTPVQPTTVLGDVTPHAGGAAEVFISNFEGTWSGPDEMVVSFDLENTGTTAFAWAESQVYGRDRKENHARGARLHLAVEPSEGLVGQLPPRQRARAAILVKRAQEITGPMTIVLGEQGGGRPIMAIVGDWMPRQTRHSIQMMELRPVQSPDPERDRVSIHLQGVYGAIWLGDGAGLGKSDATSMKGLGVRAQYAFNRYIALDGEVIGASTGEARFGGVTYDGMQGDLTRSAALGRVQFGGVLRFSEGPYVPLLRLGVGLQGASQRGTLTTATGEEPGPESFDLKGLLSLATGVDVRLGNHFIAGAALGAVFLGGFDEVQSIELGVHLGYAWNP
jgi:hypothetical protein